MIISFGLNKALKEGKYKSAVPVKPEDKYEVGQWYWCGYWQQAYKVTHVKYKTVQGKQLLEHIETKDKEDGIVKVISESEGEIFSYKGKMIIEKDPLSTVVTVIVPNDESILEGE